MVQRLMAAALFLIGSPVFVEKTPTLVGEQMDGGQAHRLR